MAFGRADDSRRARSPGSRPEHDHRPDTSCGPSSRWCAVRAGPTAIDELEPGLAAMAAPVRGAAGEVVAALSITGPTVRMTPPRIAELQSDPDRRGAGARAAASATTTKENTPHDARGDPATALRRDARRQRARRQGRRQRRAGARARARADALRRADPVARGGRRAVRARRLLRARDADRRAGDAGRARHPAPAAGRDRHRRRSARS